MGAGQSSRHPLLSRLESGSMSSAVFRMVSVANKKTSTTLICNSNATLTFWKQMPFHKTLWNTEQEKTMKRVACMEERIGWFSAADFIFSQKQTDLFMVLHETIRFCFAFQSMWMSFGMCWFCAFCMFWPQWSWMAAIILCGCSRLIEDQSFHVNRVIRNPTSISLPVPPCSAAATPEPVLIELHHLGVTHGCRLQKISPGRAHLWFFNVLYVYTVCYA